jgi:NADH dehydrogenase
LVLKVTERKRILLPIPFWVAEMQAFVLEKLPKPLLTTDQIRLMQTDNVLSGDQKTLSDLGITPMAAEAILPTYLHRYRIPRAQAHATGS